MSQETGWRDPGDNEAQRRYLHSFRPRNYYIAGRGSGKTAVACMKAFIAASMSPGVIGYITEQTNPDILDILIPAWRAIVPAETYKLKSIQNKYEVQLVNGSVIKFRSRQAKNTIADPPFRGPSAGFIIHDEIALDTRDDVPNISEMMLRDHHAKWLFADYITTPKTNWFYGHVLSQGIAEPGKHIQISEDGNAAAFYGSTRDNAYNRNLYGRMVGHLSEKEAQQELEGWFVAQEGRCWTGFVDDEWPYGNRIDDGGFNHDQKYVLSVDHGGSVSCWQLYQARDGAPYKRWSLVAEYTPHGVQPHDIIADIKTRYGNPSRIFAGHDHTAHGGTVGTTAEYLFEQYGWGSMTEVVGAESKRKEVQSNRLAFALSSISASAAARTAPQRRLLISNQLESHHPGPTRGVLDMLQHDTWPEPGYAHTFRKEKGKKIFHEDSRDALLYWAVSMYPPIWAEHTNRAA